MIVVRRPARSYRPIDPCHNCGAKLVYRLEEFLISKHWAKCPECNRDHYWKDGRWNTYSDYDAILAGLDKEFPGYMEVGK